MKKIALAAFAALALAASLAAPARAAEESYDKGYSTWTATAVHCTTGTAVDITPSLPGFTVGRIRVINAATTKVYLGHNSSVSSSTGEPLFNGTAGSYGQDEFLLGKNPDQQAAVVRIWCNADSTAGSGGLNVIEVAFGYK